MTQRKENVLVKGNGSRKCIPLELFFFFFCFFVVERKRRTRGEKRQQKQTLVDVDRKVVRLN